MRRHPWCSGATADSADTDIERSTSLCPCADLGGHAHALGPGSVQHGDTIEKASGSA